VRACDHRIRPAPAPTGAILVPMTPIRLAILCSLALTGCSSHPEPVRGPPLPRVPLQQAGTPAEEPAEDGFVGFLEDDDLDESSGLVPSRKHPGIFWSLNDSGGQAVLYALAADGAARGRVRVRTAVARDWEDLAVDPTGALWIHDGGNNANRRRDLTVYRVPEPDTLDGHVTADRAVRYRFPDQDRFPPPDRMNYDSEALFWDGDRMLLLTKHRSDTRTRLFRFPAGVEDDVTWSAEAMARPGKKPEPVALELLGDFDVGGDPDNHGGHVTAADLSRDGRHLAVLTYHALFVFARPEGSPNWLAGAHRRIDFEQSATLQCEAIAWDGDALLFTNEQGSVMRIANPHDPACVRFPSPECRTR